jgi:hypothetical protein
VCYAHAGSEADAAAIAGRNLLDDEKTVELSRVVYRTNLQLPPDALLSA